MDDKLVPGFLAGKGEESGSLRWGGGLASS